MKAQILGNNKPVDASWNFSMFLLHGRLKMHLNPKVKDGYQLYAVGKNAEIWDIKRAEESGMAVVLAVCRFGRVKQPQFILGEEHEPMIVSMPEKLSISSPLFYPLQNNKVHSHPHHLARASKFSFFKKFNHLNLCFIFIHISNLL